MKLVLRGNVGRQDGLLVSTDNTEAHGKKVGLACKISVRAHRLDLWDVIE